jgi:hypothetical protein
MTVFIICSNRNVSRQNDIRLVNYMEKKQQHWNAVNSCRIPCSFILRKLRLYKKTSNWIHVFCVWFFDFVCNDLQIYWWFECLWEWYLTPCQSTKGILHLPWSKNKIINYIYSFSFLYPIWYRLWQCKSVSKFKQVRLLKCVICNFLYF